MIPAHAPAGTWVYERSLFFSIAGLPGERKPSRCLCQPATAHVRAALHRAIRGERRDAPRLRMSCRSALASELPASRPRTTTPSSRATAGTSRRNARPATASTASTTASPPSSAGTPSASSPRSVLQDGRAHQSGDGLGRAVARRRAARARSPPTTARCPRPAPKQPRSQAAPEPTYRASCCRSGLPAGAGSGLANMSAVMPAYQPMLSA